MHLKKTLVLCAIWAICTGAVAFAEDKDYGFSLLNTQGVQPVRYLDEAAADDDPITEGCYEPTCCDAAPATSCGACGGCSTCDLGDPWTLFGQSCSGVTVGGWLSAGIFGNARGTANNGPLGFNDVGDGATFNQFYLFAEKAADTGGYGTDWGFRVDYVFGADGQDTQAFGAGGLGRGWDNRWDTSGDYGSAMPQLYAEFAIDNLSIKAGHFYTIIGWEVVPAPDNFFYSHAYTMFYGEPFTHTGFLATYSVSDNLTAHGGWVQGWDTGFDNTLKSDMFLGGLSYGLSDDATLTWACSAGNVGITPAGVDLGSGYMNSFVLELILTDDLTYIFQHDLGKNDGGPADGDWYGINQYLQYQLNDCWAAGMRIEWFRDNDGVRISQNGAATGSYYELTAGLNWRPQANVTVRPELRYDWFNGVAAAGNQPFNNGNSTDQFSGGFDVIFTY